MKKILIILLLLFPAITNAGLCLSGEYYKIVDYDINKEVTIKGLGIYDIFLSGPLFKTDSIIIDGRHYVNNTFCEYENFDSLHSLGFSDLVEDDKWILISNLIAGFMILIFVIFLVIIFYKTAIALILFVFVIISWLLFGNSDFNNDFNENVKLYKIETVISENILEIK